ncbi:MAG: glucosaminidase domain-containing protein [Crocinitomicaceae bacterium]
MKKVIFILAVGLTQFSFGHYATRKDYIETWKDEAIKQMNQYQIPASITLAQAVLESQYGNSKLSTEANNHFGIKCHKWTGETFFQDDDAKNECFRKYDNPNESFKDHSEFLKYRDRYATLFELKLTDYKSWAKGLKKCGYATNPKYADLLIDIIEEYQLYQYDYPPKVAKVSVHSIENKTEYKSIKSGSFIAPKHNKHKVEVKPNGVHFVVAQKGDTFYKISKEFELGLWQLYKYNDYGKKKDVLIPGDIIYLQPKKGKPGKQHDRTITLIEASSLREISQKYAMKLNVLLKKNNVSQPDETLASGTKIILK